MFKNIRIKKRGGGTRLQRVKVLKSGKFKFVKNPKNPGTKRSRKSSRKSNPNRRVNKTARKKRRRRGKSLQQTAFKWIRIGSIFLPAGAIAIQSGKSNLAKIEEFTEAYTGYNLPQRRMNWGSLMRGWGPFLGACVATYGIPKLMSILRRL